MDSTHITESKFWSALQDEGEEVRVSESYWPALKGYLKKSDIHHRGSKGALEYMSERTEVPDFGLRDVTVDRDELRSQP